MNDRAMRMNPEEEKQHREPLHQRKQNSVCEQAAARERTPQERVETLKVQMHEELVNTHDGAEFNTIMKALEGFHKEVVSDELTQ